MTTSEDDTFEALAKPDFETLNSLFKSKFPNASPNYFTPDQIDYIRSCYWSHTVFGQIRMDNLYQAIREMANDISKHITNNPGKQWIPKKTHSTG